MEEKNQGAVVTSKEVKELSCRYRERVPAGIRLKKYTCKLPEMGVLALYSKDQQHVIRSLMDIGMTLKYPESLNNVEYYSIFAGADKRCLKWLLGIHLENEVRRINGHEIGIDAYSNYLQSVILDYEEYDKFDDEDILKSDYRKITWGNFCEMYKVDMLDLSLDEARKVYAGLVMDEYGDYTVDFCGLYMHKFGMPREMETPESIMKVCVDEVHTYSVSVPPDTIIMKKGDVMFGKYKQVLDEILKLDSLKMEFLRTIRVGELTIVLM